MSLLTAKESSSRDYDGRDLSEVNRLLEARVEALTVELRILQECVRELQSEREDDILRAIVE